MDGANKSQTRRNKKTLYQRQPARRHMPENEPYFGWFVLLGYSVV